MQLLYTATNPLEEYSHPQYPLTATYISPIICTPNSVMRAINPLDPLSCIGIIRKVYYQDWLFKCSLSEHQHIWGNMHSEKVKPYWDMFKWLILQHTLMYQNTPQYGWWYQANLDITNWDAVCGLYVKTGRWR